jgi:hypothetical protein
LSSNILIFYNCGKNNFKCFNIGIKRSEKGGKMARNVSLKFVLKVYHAVRVIKSLLVNFTEKTLKDQGD